MCYLTRAQRVALKRVYDRTSLYRSRKTGYPVGKQRGYGKPLTYREWRRHVTPTIGMDRCVVVPWCGMFLAIETDGYTHS